MADRAAQYPFDCSRPRPQLAAVLRATDRLVRVDDVMATLGIDRPAAAKTLARWHPQGWLQRVGPGLYTPIPLDTLATEQVLDFDMNRNDHRRYRTERRTARTFVPRYAIELTPSGPRSAQMRRQFAFALVSLMRSK